jgi:hypothetical protein
MSKLAATTALADQQHNEPRYVYGSRHLLLNIELELLGD